MSGYIEPLVCKLSAQRIFDGLHQERFAVFLDSSKKGELGQYAIIGLHPYFIVKEERGICFVNEQPMDISFAAFLKQYLKEHREENPTQLPMISGGIGYFSYDYGMAQEGIKTNHKKKGTLPEALVVFYDNYIIEDLENKKMYVIANGKKTEEKKSIRQIKDKIAAIENAGGKDFLCTYKKQQGDGIEKIAQPKQYQKAIRKIKSYIREGHIYVMNMTQQMEVKSQRKPYEVFCHLQKKNPSPFAAYMNVQNAQIISASPELFLRIRNGKMETRPIKGTRKRGATPQEDNALRAELEQSEKDKSELMMIVDLERNDFNRVCVPGSVTVTKMYELETYATVFHLVSYIEGVLEPQKDVIDVLQAVFPGGSITGAPKIRAMEIIDELEQQSRGLYTGIIGYLSLDGDCEFNIAIRTAVHENQIYRIGVGGGITYESEENFEYEETLQKAKALLEAVLGS